MAASFAVDHATNACKRFETLVSSALYIQLPRPLFIAKNECEEQIGARRIQRIPWIHLDPWDVLLVYARSQDA